MYSTLAIVAAVASFVVQRVNAVPIISQVGSKFFDSDGKQFFIKGGNFKFAVFPELELTRF